jgi:ATP-binding cassette subfamily B protein
MKLNLILPRIISTIIISKIISTSSPYIFKRAIDNQNNKDQAVLLFGSYYLSRLATSYLNEVRNVMVNRESFNYTNNFCNKMITGNVVTEGVFMKKIERARKGYKSMFTIRYTHILPTFIELALSSSLLVTHMNPVFSGILLSTIGFYMYRSVKITNKRIEERKILNLSENNLYSGKTNDQLNEVFKLMTINEEKLVISLKNINVEQQSILAGGNIILLLLWFKDPTMGISDFVMLNMLASQVYQPLNQAGMIYREWYQSKHDINEVKVNVKH